MALVLANPPHPDVEQGSADPIAYYFGTLLAFHHGSDAYTDWRSKVVVPWNAAMRSADDGCAAGSWDPVGPWGKEGGRVFSTALCTMVSFLDFNAGHRIVRTK
jgi:hypothetical protein